MKIRAKNVFLSTISDGKKRKPNVLSRLFLWWPLPLLWKGFRQSLEEGDLLEPDKTYESTPIGDYFERYWLKECENAKKGNRKPTLWRALCRAYGLSYLIPAFHVIAAAACRIIQPLIFSHLLSYWGKEHAISQTEAIYYALGMIGLSFLGSLCTHHGSLILAEFSLKVQIACSSLLYKKLLRTSVSSLASVEAGNLVNLMGNDQVRFLFGLKHIHYFWVVPLQTAASLYCMYTIAGFAPLVGIAVLFIVIIPLQSLLTKLSGTLRGKIARETDKRLNLMGEIINGIQVIKMYAWEKPFQTAAQALRKPELKALNKGLLVRNILFGVSLLTQQTILLFTSLFLILTGSPVTAAKIFPIFQYINIIEINFASILPFGMANFTEMLVSLERTEQYLLLDEKTHQPGITEKEIVRSENDNGYDMKSPPNIALQKSTLDNLQKKHFDTHVITEIPNTEDNIIEVNDVTASWPGSTEIHIKNVQFHVNKGEICAIVGPVGSGKSSLLQVLLKELPIMQGNFKINGTISYASQQAWLLPTSVRENILFGSPYDVKKYMEVCKVCSLLADFKNFPFGDQSLVGENGTVLSGGQRARVNLARAVYKEADIYLLDDPLSAVDSVVGRQLFDCCIKKFLHGRTCLMVTHQIHFINEVDRVIIVNKGMVESSGTYDELLASGTDFSAILTSQVNKTAVPETAETPSKNQSLLRQLSGSFKDDKNEEFKEQVLQEEHRAEGHIKLRVWIGYLRSVKSWLVVSFAACFLILGFAAMKSGDYWLSYWTNEVALSELNNETDTDFSWGTQIGLYTNTWYLSIYAGLLLLVILFLILRTIFFVIIFDRASKNLHEDILRRVTMVAMDFFSKNPSGAVLNRFSKDLDALDESIPRYFVNSCNMYGTMIGSLVVNVILVPAVILPAIFLLAAFLMFFTFFLRTAQALKRLDSTTRSPMLGMLRSTMSGLPTIRSSNSQSYLQKIFYKAQNLNTKAFYTVLTEYNAYHLYLDFICLIYIALVLLIFVVFDFASIIPVGSVGVVVSQSVALIVYLQWGAYYSSELLSQFVSVERVLEYTELPIEKNYENASEKIPDSWPNKGKVEFKNVCLTYGTNIAPALKDINIEISSGSKVGVVGRTGAGKSSLISALFLLSDIEGCIKIDGIDTHTISKQLLRKRMSIIPQEPVLFSGTVRYNLDPFGAYSDAEIWKALEQVELKETIPVLDMKVSTGGSNFSVGQRQLICLARAILRSNKVLIMDEATANVDPMTDALIQTTIRKEFSTCTVITIAHRLNTVMDSDKILVMENGQVVEFDHPYLLLSNPESKLNYMVNETDLREVLLKIAKDKYESEFGMTTQL